MNQGWIGVDLDGTLAYYDGWKGPDHIGDPVPRMLARVKTWLSEGKDVRIVTARVNPSVDFLEIMQFESAIDRWCVKHLGKILPLTCEKDFQMIELWDDRCVQVIPNTGERADGRE